MEPELGKDGRRAGGMERKRCVDRHGLLVLRPFLRPPYKKVLRGTKTAQRAVKPDDRTVILWEGQSNLCRGAR